MSTKTQHLLHLAAIAAFLYVLAFVAQAGGVAFAFTVLLPAGMIAEILFWIRLFKPAKERPADGE